MKRLHCLKRLKAVRKMLEMTPGNVLFHDAEGNDITKAVTFATQPFRNTWILPVLDEVIAELERS